MYPGTMTGSVSAVSGFVKERHLLVVLRDTSLASFAVLASERRSNHARSTEVLVVKLPKTQELVDNSLLLAPATRLWDKAGVLDHAQDVEVRTSTVCNAE